MFPRTLLFVPALPHRSTADHKSWKRAMASAGSSVALSLVAVIIPLMFLLPYVYTYPGPRYAIRRVCELLWATSALLLLLHPGLRGSAWSRWRRFRPGTRGAALGFIAWAGLSALLSAAPQYALREWALYTLLAVAVLPLSAAIDGRIRVLKWSFVFTLLIYGLAALTHSDHGFAHPRFQGQALAVSAPIILLSGHSLAALAAAPAVAAGLLEGSRALIVALAAAFLAATAWVDRKNRLLRAAVSLTLAAGIVGAGLTLGKVSGVAGAMARGVSTTGRVSVWLETLALWKATPLLGVGPALLGADGGLGGWAAHPHNALITVLGETGIVGLALAGFLLVRGLRALLNVEQEVRPWAIACVSTGMHAMFSGTLIMPASQTLAVLVLAVLLSPSRNLTVSSDDDRSDRRAGWILLVVGVLAVSILLWTLALPGGEPGSATLGPRFWINGVVP